MIRAFMVNPRHSATLAATGTDNSNGFALDRGLRGPDKSVCDTAHVDVGSWHSLRFWSGTLGISETQLLRITRRVGPSIERIERFLTDKRERRQRRLATAE